MPSGSSAGEKRTFDVLQKLPEDCIVYFEPPVGTRHPDFVIIMPRAGIMIIEVKGWYQNSIKDFDHHNVTLSIRGRESKHKHPLQQARQYKFKLMNQCQAHTWSKHLLHQTGEHEGRLLFPFGHVAVMSNMERHQVDALTADGSQKFLWPQNSICRDELFELEYASSEEVNTKLLSFFDPVWPIQPMTDQQVDALRGVLHPQINLTLVQQASLPDDQLRVLDLEQEAKARQIGDGHRIIRGVAGSGKTVLLIARAKMLAEDPSKRILVLCFNKALARYFNRVFAEFSNITAVHFHAWAGSIGAKFDPNESDASYGDRVLTLLERGSEEFESYDAVCIDEAQDFDRTWFTSAKLALKEREDGDLLIVMDGNQSLYKRPPFTWSSAGIHARGRVLSEGRFDLTRNYRNTYEILSTASKFARSIKAHDDDIALQSVLVEPESARRRGEVPRYYQADTRANEASRIVSEVERLLSSQSNLQPGEIAVLYPGHPPQMKKDQENLLKRLSEKWPVTFKGDAFELHGASRDEAIKVETIHSAKGLQYKAVIICWIDLLPYPGDVDRTARDSALLYVGMTRAEESLTLTSTGRSKFTTALDGVRAF